MLLLILMQCATRFCCQSCCWDGMYMNLLPPLFNSTHLVSKMVILNAKLLITITVFFVNWYVSIQTRGSAGAKRGETNGQPTEIQKLSNIQQIRSLIHKHIKIHIIRLLKKQRKNTKRKEKKNQSTENNRSRGGGRNGRLLLPILQPLCQIQEPPLPPLHLLLWPRRWPRWHWVHRPRRRRCQTLLHLHPQKPFLRRRIPPQVLSENHLRIIWLDHERVLQKKNFGQSIISEVCFFLPNCLVMSQ